MKYKIIVSPELELNHVKELIDNGAKFITFQYCISVFFAVTLLRLSSAILVTEKNISNYRKKYNTLSYIFGWWGFPYGPSYTFRSLRLNKKGGIDVTKDIMLNLTDNCIKNKEVELVHVHTIYSEPPKSDKKELIKAFASIFKSDSNVQSLIVAQFVNTEDNIEPHIVIGLQVKSNFDHYAAIIEKQFYKRFYKHVYYELLNLTEEPEQKELLKEQGYTIVSQD